MGGAYMAIGVMASAFTRNSIIAFIAAFAISFVLFIVGQVTQFVPGRCRGWLVPRHRQSLREHQPRRHRHPRRHLLRLGDGRLPAVCDAVPRIAAVEVRRWQPNRKPEKDGPRGRRRRDTTGRKMGRKALSASNAIGLRAADHRRGGADQPDRHARVRPPRPDREPRLHAGAGLEGDRREPARLPDRQGVHLEGAAARAAVRRRYVRDLLDEYRTYSKGKLRFEAFDPGDDKKIEEEAGQCKVQKLQVQVMREQKFEVGALLPRHLLPVPGQGRSDPAGDAGRGARVPDLVAAEAADAEEAEDRGDERPRRGGRSAT